MMKKLAQLGIVAAGLAVATAAAAQDESSNRFEPYIAVMGSHHDFDSEANSAGYPVSGPSSGLVDGILGVNVPIGDTLFIGAEGFGAKGIKGPTDWEYGAVGRIGIRTGDSSLFFGKAGRRWVKFDSALYPGLEVDDMVYGGGVELAPGGRGSHLRVRAEIETFGDFHSIRPSMGVVLGF